MATDEELAGAREAARLAEAEAGRLRGEISELKTQLARARQDQEAFQRVLDGVGRVRSLMSRVKNR